MKKTILITGASSGMGKATALQLIKEGHTVYGAARRLDKMQELVQAGGQALKLDVTDETQIQTAIDTIISEQGQIDILINNAGYGIYGAVEETTMEDARHQFEVNFFGLARITQLVLPFMRKQGNGTIINITSMGGKIYTPLGAWYHATKHAVEGWSDCLRLETKPHGIKVVIVEPGLILTEFGDVLYQPMLDRSGTGPYVSMAQSIASATKAAYEKGDGSSPYVIANTISKIVKSKNPKTRYAVGKLAKPLMWMRKNLSDKMFDKIIMSQIK